MNKNTAYALRGNLRGGHEMTPDEKLVAALELFRQLQEKDQVNCLENLRRLSTELETCPVAPE